MINLSKESTKVEVINHTTCTNINIDPLINILTVSLEDEHESNKKNELSNQNQQRENTATATATQESYQNDIRGNNQSTKAESKCFNFNILECQEFTTISRESLWPI